MGGRRTGRRRTALGLTVAVAVAVAGCGTATDDSAPTVSASAASADVPAAPGAVWPSRDGAVLVALQNLTDRGRRPDLLDPVTVARQYAAVAIPGASTLARAAAPVTGAFTSTGPTTGEVDVSGVGLAPSTVYLRQLDRDAPGARPGPGPPIWYVQGVGTALLAVLDVDYDGQRLVASFIPTSDGTLTVRVTGVDESLLAEQTTSAQAGHLSPIDVDAPGQPALVVSATLALPDDSIAPREFRVGPPPPPS